MFFSIALSSLSQPSPPARQHPSASLPAPLYLWRPYPSPRAYPDAVSPRRSFFPERRKLRHDHVPNTGGPFLPWPWRLGERASAVAPWRKNRLTSGVHRSLRGGES